MTELTIPTRVLIIEDDPNIVDLIRSNLAVRGFDDFPRFGCQLQAMRPVRNGDLLDHKLDFDAMQKLQDTHDAIGALKLAREALFTSY